MREELKRSIAAAAATALGLACSSPAPQGAAPQVRSVAPTDAVREEEHTNREDLQEQQIRGTPAAPPPPPLVQPTPVPLVQPNSADPEPDNTIGRERRPLQQAPTERASCGASCSASCGSETESE